MILEPDGLRYLIPENAQTQEDSLSLCAHVWFSYHPSFTPSCQGYEVFSADETDIPGVYYVQEGYIVGGQEAADVFAKRCDVAVEEAELDDPLDPWICATDIHTRIQHHSRWGVVKNDGGGGGTTTIPDLPHPLE